METEIGEGNGEKMSKLLSVLSSGLNAIARNSNVRYINPTNYNLLGPFHKQMLTNFGEMYGMVSKNKEVDYFDFVKVMENLLKQKTSIEKQYLWGLFFPETVKHATFLNPFPVPVFTYKQNFTFHLTPNTSGNFLLQFIVPSMVELGFSPTVSDTYYINDNGLNGNSTAVLPIVAVDESRVAANVFQAFVLSAASVKVSYFGRLDVSSGYFGGSYHLSSTDVHDFDRSAQDFNFIDNSFNSARGKLFSGLSIVYFPQDTGFQEFKKPNTNSSGNFIPMSHRINVYGRGLPSSVLSNGSVVVTITKVYATLPVPGFNDIISVSSEVSEISNEEMNAAHTLIKENGLSVIESDSRPMIEKFLKLHEIERNEVIDSIPKVDNVIERRDMLLGMVRNYESPSIKVKINN